MAIREHPSVGSILMCDFNTGFRPPEMVKRRPVLVVSPKIAARPGLCTVVALSTTAPNPVMPYHCQIQFAPTLPAWMKSDGVWVKGDMVSAIALHRLDFIGTGKDVSGRRRYYYNTLNKENLKAVRAAVLSGLGLASLTKHL